MADYPSALKTWVPVSDGVEWVLAAHINEAYEEIIATQTELGTDVAGSLADLKTRLAIALDDDGTLKLSAITEHTGIADNNIVEIDSVDAASGEIARFTANGLESRSDAEMKTQLGYLTDLSDDSTPTAGGTLDMNSNDIDNIRHATFIAEVDNGNSGTADTIDFGAGQKQKSTMTDDCTYTFTAPDGPGNFVFKLIQGTSPPHNPTWPATVKWESGVEPTWSTTLDAIDIISFYYDGTNYYGSAGTGYA